jgi:YbgC/YbaW family acyl-CoA thioester hydrolase
MIYVKKNVRVLPDDTDAFGRLNWLAYVRYCEEGEAGLMEMLDFSVMRFYKAQRISFPRRAAIFEYFSPVSPDSFIDIETTLKEWVKRRLLLHMLFTRKTAKRVNASWPQRLR